VTTVLASILVLVLLAPVELPSQPANAAPLVVAKPQTLSLSGDKVIGAPVRLSWSPDGLGMYLLAVERDLWGNEKEHHYLVDPADGAVKPFHGEPKWATDYWAWKSGLACPGVPSFKVEIESRTERKTATGAGAGGSMAQNSGDPYGPGSALGPQGAAIFAAGTQSQMVTTTLLKLRGRVFSQFVNTRPILGLTYGWAPEGLDLIAFSDEKHELELMDAAGTRTIVKSTKGVVLPAWSGDGRRLAWLVQQRRGRLALMIAAVSKRDVYAKK
jgi:hypothetical protein